MNSDEIWSAQVDDLVGGAIVTTFAAPASKHDHNRDGDPAKQGYIIAECPTMDDAQLVAGLLNAAGAAAPKLASPLSED